MPQGCWISRFTVASVLAAGLGVLSATPAEAQFLRGGRNAAAEKPEAKPKPEEAPVTIEMARRMVDPNEPIAIVNGEPITRQQLADECVARKGEEILETLINKKMIEQAIRSGKVEITATEIDAEIEKIAQEVAGVGRDKWLATLAKERKISPSQYARDVIFPMLAMRKLAAPHVQVTDQDITDAFSAQFGEKLQCRMILLNSLPIAKQVWEELKTSPELFEKLARERSIDPTTRSVGGMLPEPIARHSYPRSVSDSAFEQLVDGMKLEGTTKTKGTPVYQPKDGDISGIIQVTEATWIILKREGVLPARPHDNKDPALRKQMHDMIFEAKVQETIGELYDGLMRDAAIENRLTGQVKPAGAEELSPTQLGGEVKLMSNPAAAPAAAAASPAPVDPATIPASGVIPAPPGQAAPAGVSAEDAKRASDLNKKP